MKKKTLLSVLLTLGLIIGLNFVFAYTEGFSVSAKSTGTVTGSNLNVRTKAGTDQAIVTINGSNVSLQKGQTVDVLKESDGWYKVSFTYDNESVTGWVSGDFLLVTKDKEKETTGPTATPVITPTPKPAAVSAGITAKTTADSLRVRKTASEKGALLTISKTNVTLKQGTSVKILKEKLSKDQKWYYVSFDWKGKTRKGYVLSDYVNISFTKNVSAKIQTASKVKIKKAAGSDKSYLKIGKTTVSLKNNTEITVIKESADKKGNKWFKIAFPYKEQIQFGYIEAKEAKLTGMVNKTGSVTATTLNVRKTAGTKGAKLTYNGASVSLSKGEKVTILLTKKAENITWYKISFIFKGKTLKGYVSGQYVSIGTVNDFILPTDSSGEPSQTEKPKETEKPDETQAPDASASPKPTDDPQNTASPTPIPAGEFNDYLTQQGFPESYKASLMNLHSEHPNWIFKAYQTGLDWNTVIENESRMGLNLVNKNKTSGWLSYEEGAYNYSTGSFVPFDGSTWVAVSKAGTAYYMDPRNFFTQTTIFQFEALEYQTDHQIQSGVENILKNTPMYNTTFTYMDETTGQEETILYSKAFMDAAEQSGVSPYHLAARVKQEVIRSATAFSDSVTGTVLGYEGYYNFYNIGATHSTKSGGAIANGLNFAKGNTITSTANKDAYCLPWDNRYKAIVGGAKYIGTNYINRGQNTIYLQKFNVTPNSTYTHQYMANIEAANAEAVKTYTAYSGMGLLDNVLVFNIPVYTNMPETVSPVPEMVKNPNNWLKMLSIDNFSLSPIFKTADGGSKIYSVIVDDSNITDITLNYAPVSSTASVTVQAAQNGISTSVSQNNGMASIPLALGDNTISVMVTAENLDVKTYTIVVTKTQ